MKTIIYILVAVLISTSLISAYSGSKGNDTTSLTFNCTNNCTPDRTAMSLDIFESRLKLAGINDYSVNYGNSKGEINLELQNKSDVTPAIELFTSKGATRFYEVSTNEKVINTLKNDNQLSRLMEIRKTANMESSFNGILGDCSPENVQKVTAYMNKAYSDLINSEIRMCWSYFPDEQGNLSLYILNSESPLNNSYVSNVNIIGGGSSPALQLLFNKEGAGLFRELTSGNIKKPVAVVLDNQVLTAPIVRAPINDGNCMITGDFKLSKLKIISYLISSDELPSDFELKK